MSETLSLSTFKIEADRKPVLAFAPKKYIGADAFFRDARRPCSANGLHLKINVVSIGLVLIVAAPLGECIREFTARATATRHLYEIQTAARHRWPAPSCPERLSPNWLE